MTTDEMSVALDVLGASIVEEQHLPPGIGVLPQEVGASGPWYGVKFADGRVVGWAHIKDGLGPLVLSHLNVPLLLRALVNAARDSRAADREFRVLSKALSDTEKDLVDLSCARKFYRVSNWWE